jgi:hypothetical protein
MYCPVCFQNTLKIRSSGVIKLSFNGKSRNTSLFTYNLQKESQEQLNAKLREKIVDFFSFYSEFANRTPIKFFEAYSADFICINNCKIDLLKTKVSVIGIMYSLPSVKAMLDEEGHKFSIKIETDLLN